MSAPGVDAVGVAADRTRPTGLFESLPSASAFGLYLPATLVVRVVNFARIVLLTWLMAEAEFGLLSMMTVLINVLTPVCSLGLNDAVQRYVPQHEARGSLAGFARRSLWLVLAAAGTTCLIVLATAGVIGPIMLSAADPAAAEASGARILSLTRWSALVVVPLILYFFLLSALRGLRMTRAMVLTEFVHSLLFLLITAGLCLAGRRSAEAVTFAYGASLLASIAVTGWGFARRLSRWPAQSARVSDAGLGRRLLHYGVSAMVAGVALQAMLYFPAWRLNRDAGPSSVAIFTAARQLGHVVLLGAMTVVTIAGAAVTRTWESAGRDTALRQLSLAFRGGVTGLFLLCAACSVASELIMRLFSPAYAAGSAILPLQMLFFLLAADLAFVATYYGLVESPRLSLVPYMVGIGVTAVVASHLMEPIDAPVAGRGEAGFLVHRLLRVGLQDSALAAISWAAVAGGVVAVGVSLLLMRTVGVRLDRRCFAVLALGPLLVLRPALLAVSLVFVAGVAIWTSALFSREERTELRRFVGRMVRSTGSASI